MGAEGLSSRRLLLVYLDERLASSRLRVLDMRPWLEARGARVECLPYPTNLRGRRELLKRADAADLVLVQKKLPGPLDAALWRSIDAPVVFDFDDALPFRNEPKRGRWESSTRRRRFDRAIGSADGVIAGNAYLGGLAAAVDAAKPVLVSPTPVPLPGPSGADEAERRNGSAVGWIGGSGNLAALGLVRGPLARVAERHDLRLVVISDGTIELEGVRVEHVPWTLESQERELARLDVGIMPLADDPWSRGKCAYKLLQYMAAGVPAVASPVGMNAELIRDGENGLLAADEASWEQALDRLLTDRAFRDELGRAGRDTVAAGHTFPRAAERLERFFAERIASPTGRSPR